jgi:hypothetical protein
MSLDCIELCGAVALVRISSQWLRGTHLASDSWVLGSHADELTNERRMVNRNKRFWQRISVLTSPEPRASACHRSFPLLRAHIHHRRPPPPPSDVRSAAPQTSRCSSAASSWATMLPPIAAMTPAAVDERPHDRDPARYFPPRGLAPVALFFIPDEMD